MNEEKETKMEHKKVKQEVRELLKEHNQDSGYKKPFQEMCIAMMRDSLRRRREGRV